MSITETEIKKIIDEKRRDGTLAEWYWNIADTDNEFLIQVISHLSLPDTILIVEGGKIRSNNNLSKTLDNLIKKGCEEDAIIKIKKMTELINSKNLMEE